MAIVTHKLMLLFVFLFKNYCSVAKFAVYFHRKEFRRKKPFGVNCNPNKPCLIIPFQLTSA